MSARTHPRLTTSTRSVLAGAVLLLSTMLLAGCITLVDTEGSQEQRVDAIVTLAEGEDFQQTFTSRRAGLKQIELWLRPPAEDPNSAGYVKAELWSIPKGPGPVAEAVFTPAQIISGGETVSLTFPPLRDSESAGYELVLSSSGGVTQVLGRFEDVYGGGTAAQDGTYLLADAAFRLAYEYNQASVLEDIRQMLASAWLLLPLAVVVLLSGWMLLEWSGLASHLDAGEMVGLSLGLSLAVIPLLMAWTSLIGLHWGRWSVLVAAGLLSALAAYRIWRRAVSARQRGQAQDAKLPDSNPALARFPWLKTGPSLTAALVAIFAITLFTRTAMVRDLSAPPWVDSVHHALITRLIIESGSFPASYAPFIQLDPAGYHPGFHSLLASFLWLSKMDIQPGMLYFGQLLNALTIFSVYLLSATLLKNRPGYRLAGALAALVAGLFTPMPAYYTSWGRYTQLAALIIMPAAFALLLYSIQPAEQGGNLTILSLADRRKKPILLASIAAAGLYLTHYRVMAFFACLLLAYGLVSAIRWLLRRRSGSQGQPQAILQSVLLLGLVGVVSLVLSSPWLQPSLQNLILPRLTAWIPATAQPFSGVTWPYLNTAWGIPALVLSGLGIGLGILQRRAFPWVLVLWVGLLFFIVNLGMFGLPGSGFVNNISVTISLFMPMAVASGYLLSQAVSALQHFIPQSWHAAYRWLLAGTGVAVAVLAARQLLPLLNPVTFLFRPADRPAITWVADNIPPGETVLVNPFAWGYGQYAGGDGGYWISALGDHPTFPPPVLYGLSNSPQYIEHINTASRKIIDIAGDAQALHALLREQSIHYVYLGGRGGVLSPQLLNSSPLFAPRYARDGVFIFEVLP